MENEKQLNTKEVQTKKFKLKPTHTIITILIITIFILGNALLSQQNTTKITQQDRDYLNKVIANLEPIPNILRNIKDLMGNPTLTDDWMKEMSLELAMFSIHLEEIDEIKPTSNLKYHKSLINNMTNNYNKFIDCLIKGIDNKEPSKIEEAMTYLAKGTEYLDKATLELNNFDFD